MWWLYGGGGFFFFLLEVFRLGAALEKESISISISICMRDIKGPQYVTIAARLAVLDWCIGVAGLCIGNVTPHMLIFCIVNSSSLLGCIKTDLSCCREAAWEDTTAKVSPFPALDLGAKTRSKRFFPSATSLKSKSSPVNVQSLAWRWCLRRQATYRHSCTWHFCSGKD